MNNINTFNTFCVFGAFVGVVGTPEFKPSYVYHQVIQSDYMTSEECEKAEFSEMMRDCLFGSESALAQIWDSPEEDEAWKDL